jgi:hypothetical protein
VAGLALGPGSVAGLVFLPGFVVKAEIHLAVVTFAKEAAVGGVELVAAALAEAAAVPVVIFRAVVVDLFADHLFGLAAWVPVHFHETVEAWQPVAG